MGLRKYTLCVVLAELSEANVSYLSRSLSLGGLNGLYEVTIPLPDRALIGEEFSAVLGVDHYEEVVHRQNLAWA